MLVLLATFAQVAQEQLTKAVCLKPVFNQVLPCQHTFCTQCLQVDTVKGKFNFTRYLQYKKIFGSCRNSYLSPEWFLCD